MAFLKRPYLKLAHIKLKLSQGLISSTDASKQVADLVFEDLTFSATPETDIWREYDEAIAKATMEMITKLMKL